ncbi:MAG: hypothetical protein HQL52_05800 [Magnetococcales bacterium]|nr:hypothetical protein [Magnetococcales bacterium]
MASRLPNKPIDGINIQKWRANFVLINNSHPTSAERHPNERILFYRFNSNRWNINIPTERHKNVAWLSSCGRSVSVLEIVLMPQPQKWSVQMCAFSGTRKPVWPLMTMALFLVAGLAYVDLSKTGEQSPSATQRRFNPIQEENNRLITIQVEDDRQTTGANQKKEG